MSSYDVYSYGVVSSSTLYCLRGAFPAAEGYAEIESVHQMTGGEAANSSIVLARLGAGVKLDGNWIGADGPGRCTKALLSEFGIDSTRLPLKENYEGVREVVFAAKETRTIFGTYGRLLEHADWNMPNESDVTQAKVVCLDPFFARPSLRVAEIASSANIPMITVDCRPDDPLAELASAVVIAESYIRENFADRDPEELFRQYRAAAGGLVIFTFGDRDIWYARQHENVKFQRSFPIQAVDTTGGGDAFRAGIVYGFLQRWDDGKTVEFAAAVAALVCTRFPGVLNAPDYDAVVEFMRSHVSR